jgi:hypothetical protein
MPFEFNHGFIYFGNYVVKIIVLYISTMVQFVYYDSHYILEIMLLKLLLLSSNCFIYFGNYVVEIIVLYISTMVQFVYYDSIF